MNIQRFFLSNSNELHFKGMQRGAATAAVCRTYLLARISPRIVHTVPSGAIRAAVRPSNVTINYQRAAPASPLHRR